jgi:AraC-like DNA-binding protein
MQQVATVAIQEARLIVETAAARGVAPGTLLARARLRAADLEDPDARIFRPAFDRLIEEAVHASGDVNLGLHAAERTGEGQRLPDPLHYAVDSCATVGEQFGVLARYARLLHSDADVAFTVDGTAARMTHDLPASRALARRHLGERWLGALVLLARRQAGAGFAPREVWFAHPATRDTSAHERIFRAPLRFEQPVDALVVGRDALDVRVRHGNLRLHRVLDAYLATLLPEAVPAEVSLLVRRRVRETSRGHPPAIETVAAALAMSPRTLQRRLAEEGTSYQELVSEVREDLARQHLTESRLSISEIAFLLGFSDVSSFHRAFKRWTHETPRAYRRRAATAGHAGFDGRSGALGQGSGAQRQDASPPRT